MGDGTYLLFLLAGVAWLWHTSRAAHEKVLKISQVVCRDLNVQRLDDTVALRRFRPAWSRQGPCLRRLYRFEFSSDGGNRCAGEIALIGPVLEWVRIDHPAGHYFVDIT